MRCPLRLLLLALLLASACGTLSQRGRRDDGGGESESAEPRWGRLKSGNASRPLPPAAFHEENTVTNEWIAEGEEEEDYLDLDRILGEDDDYSDVVDAAPPTRPGAGTGSVLPLFPGKSRVQRLNLLNAQFAFDLYRELAARAGAADNIFLAPVGVSAAMAMLSLGLAGDTHQQGLRVHTALRQRPLCAEAAPGPGRLQGQGPGVLLCRGPGSRLLRSGLSRPHEPARGPAHQGPHTRCAAGRGPRNPDAAPQLHLLQRVLGEQVSGGNDTQPQLPAERAGGGQGPHDADQGRLPGGQRPGAGLRRAAAGVRGGHQHAGGGPTQAVRHEDPGEPADAPGGGEVAEEYDKQDTGGAPAQVQAGEGLQPGGGSAGPGGHGTLRQEQQHHGDHRPEDRHRPVQAPRHHHGERGGHAGRSRDRRGVHAAIHPGPLQR
ncbi:heparin cofactor 2 isoform X2 [Cervus canadensis]|uniref:heparin cofactor 2 isoform X2 n=1 Tax=Cervus canadensis TaxID=1574408 RepID=UPI001C9E94C1|nr:heparin cofactor 2 isoform X2 [Cervus canadensis]